MCSLKRICTPSFVLIGCYGSELRAHLYPYRSVWSKIVCFTRNTIFNELLICWYPEFNNYIVYYNIYIYVYIEKHIFTKFCRDCFLCELQAHFISQSQFMASGCVLLFFTLHLSFSEIANVLSEVIL